MELVFLKNLRLYSLLLNVESDSWVRHLFFQCLKVMPYDAKKEMNSAKKVQYYVKLLIKDVQKCVSCSLKCIISNKLALVDCDTFTPALCKLLLTIVLHSSHNASVISCRHFLVYVGV